MVKPRLPKEIASKLPLEIECLIYKYVPHNEKKEEKKSPYSSPTFQKEINSIQTKFLAGKSQMYLRDLDDFILDYEY